MLAAARTVVAFGLILQLAGFLKLLVIANFFGAGAILDGYYLGLVLPTFIVGVSNGMLQTGFVPHYVTARARGDRAGAAALAGLTLTWTALLVCGACLLLTLARPLLLTVLARHIDPGTQHQLALAFSLLLWTAPLNALADAGALLLNAEGKFAVAAAAPLLNALVGTVVLLWMGNIGAIALTVSLIAGLVSQLLLVAYAALRLRTGLRPRVALPPGSSRLLGTLALPVLLSTILGNFVPGFLQTVSGHAGTGAISAMGYALRLHNSLIQAVVLSVSTVLLPHFARLVSQGMKAELLGTLERVFAATLLFSAASLTAVAVTGETLVSVLLRRGNFTADDAHFVAKVWLALTAGLLGTTWGLFLARLFQARQQQWFLLLSGCVSLVVNVSLALALLPGWGVIGVALASSLSYTTVMLLFHWHTHRNIGSVLHGRTALFMLWVAAANGVAFIVATACGTAIGVSSPVAAISAQLAIIGLANLFVARVPPLATPISALLRRA